MAEAKSKEGEPHGPALQWHENGQKAHAGTVKDGEQVGLWTEWHQDGQKAETLTHSARGRLPRVGTKYGREPKIATEILIKT